MKVKFWLLLCCTFYRCIFIDVSFDTLDLIMKEFGKFGREQDPQNVKMKFWLLLSCCTHRVPSTDVSFSTADLILKKFSEIFGVGEGVMTCQMQK